MKRLMASLAVVMTVGAAGSMTFAQADKATVGYISGSWLQRCEGEPAEFGTCNGSDQHLRCFQVKNTQEDEVNCNISMAGTMKSTTGISRTYIAVDQTKMFAGGIDWLCFSYDDLIRKDSTVSGGSRVPGIWKMQKIHEPKVSCGSSGAPSPCTVGQMEQQTCPGTVQMKTCDSPFGECR
ncbi:hypothetical protein KEG38_50370 [Polyangium jinanense]|uniref:hypothetical protein n=1 Tax=Polyangium jinanense TaxID=2829994 RepID=UPI002340A487|nr:hypothetical protein [Polyangium jinanense]MDC3962125.1 hypothetical protein [Polyangium jinanense]